MPIQSKALLDKSLSLRNLNDIRDFSRKKRPKSRTSKPGQLSAIFCRRSFAELELELIEFVFAQILAPAMKGKTFFCFFVLEISAAERIFW